MLNKIKKLIAGSVAAALLALGAVPAVAMAAPGDADIQNATCKGANLNLAGGVDSQTCRNVTQNTGDDANDLVATIINIFSIIVGVVSVIMIIYGGFRYITSGGESSNITAAKNTILYAIIGLVIVALAQFIVKFVLGKATGQTT